MSFKSLSRREFVAIAGAAAGIPGLALAQSNAAPPVRPRVQEDPGRRSRTVALKTVTTLAVGTDRHYADPYNDVDLDFWATAPDGTRFALPAYVVRNGVWACNFAGSQLGEYTLETQSSVSDDPKLHGQKFTVRVTPYRGDNRLYHHGRLHAAADKHHLEHSDGTPFLWIGDTWWMGLCSRIDDDGFGRLVKDRADKGFSLIQIVAGPYPEMIGNGPDWGGYDAWDPRGRSEQGFPFEKDFARVNTGYYSAATTRIEKIVDGGLVPCIVGMWGFYLPYIGLDKVKRFWRNLVARYAAYPVVWCIAGEALMPGDFTKKTMQDFFVEMQSPEWVARTAEQKKGWTEVMRYVREIDPYHNPITIHPTEFGHDQVEDASLMDVDMLQTGHSDIYTIPNVIKDVRAAVAHEPKMPVVNGEVNYEGIAGRCWQDIIRLGFYHTMLNGAAGFTYGANGIWQVNQKGKPERSFLSWGDAPWEEAMHFPGSHQVGLGARFFARFPWWEMQRRPDWIDESKPLGDWLIEHPKQENDPYSPVAAGIPRKLRIVYLPMCFPTPPTIKAIEPDVQYTARFFDPVTGDDIVLGPVKPDADGKWAWPLPPPTVHDWLLVLEA